MQAQSIYTEDQVFMFCGHIEGHDILNLKSGYVVADTPQNAIHGMKEFGFSITAISSLTEVRANIGILEMISRRDPDVEQSEYLDLYPGSPDIYPEDKVFTFVGSYLSDQIELKMGFVIASGVDFATEYLRSHQFEIHSAVSLHELRLVEEYLKLIASGDSDEDDCGYINLKLLS